MFLRKLLSALAKRAAIAAEPQREKTRREFLPARLVDRNKTPREPKDFDRPEAYTHHGPIVHGVGLPRPAALDATIGEDEQALQEFLALPVTEQLKKIEAEVAKLPEHEQRLMMGVLAKELQRPFIPLPGPQTQAYNSQADVLLYGGAAGGGKSALLIGSAAQEHKRSLIVRRQSTELDGLISESRESLARLGDFNKVDREWTLNDGRSIKFGGMKEPDDWRSYAGRARDFIGFDEAAEFLEEQVGSILGWLRSTDPNQRCRAILASNPPRGADGEWIMRWFAPWLEPSFPDPAKPGELRWCITVDGQTQWVDGPEPVQVGAETYTPLSRTFIPARLDDNPFLARTNYRAGLQNLPEPLRSQLLKGDFVAGRRDDDWQVIPSDWIKEAQARWQPTPPHGAKMTSVGVDVAQGGPDETILAPRHGSWFAPLRAHKGIDTKDGPAVAGLVFATMRDGCEVVIDLGGGWGGSAFDHLSAQEIAVTGFVGAEGSIAKTKDGKLGFRNRRAAAWWGFREALDPNGGAYIALPPDPALAADLATPRWRLTSGGILIEDKAEIRKRLGRSPDRGDAVVMAWAHGSYREQVRRSDAVQQSTANVGYAGTKRFAGGQPQNRQTTANLGRAARMR